MIKHITRALMISSFALVASAQEAPNTKVTEPLSTISRLDVPRYMGDWHEIARTENWFQKDCQGAAKATYTLQPDGKVRVANLCRLASGEVKEAVGQARQIGSASSAKLEVRFAPAWLSFLPFVWGDYWVIDLDNDYQLVAVSEPSRKYLWILSRTPTVDLAAYENLLGRLKQKGFDPQQLRPSQKN
jgi:apolipoprotein D and lipocalin family protein